MNSSNNIHDCGKGGSVSSVSPNTFDLESLPQIINKLNDITVLGDTDEEEVISTRNSVLCATGGC